MPIARRAPTLRFRQSCTGESLVRGVAFVDGRISCWHNLQTQRIDDRCEGGLADTKCAPTQSAAAPINRPDRESSETRYAHRCARIARGRRIRGRAPSQLCSPIAQLASIPKALAAVIRISGRSAGVVAPDSRRHRRYLLLAKYHRTFPPQRLFWHPSQHAVWGQQIIRTKSAVELAFGELPTPYWGCRHSSLSLTARPQSSCPFFLSFFSFLSSTHAIFYVTPTSVKAPGFTCWGNDGLTGKLKSPETFGKMSALGLFWSSI